MGAVTTASNSTSRTSSSSPGRKIKEDQATYFPHDYKHSSSALLKTLTFKEQDVPHKPMSGACKITYVKLRKSLHLPQP